MLRLLAILAMAFYVLPVQAYAQPDKTHKASDSGKPATPTPAPVIPKQTDSPNLQPKPKTNVDTDVRIISTPGKDGYDKAAFWVNLALVVVGIGGIRVAVMTLRKIERQTAATEEATKIAKASMEALINKERARIHLVREYPSNVDSLHRGFVREMIDFGDTLTPMTTDMDEFQVIISNTGETTARDVTASYAVTLTDGSKNVLLHEFLVDQIGDMKPSGDPVPLLISVFQGLEDNFLELIHEEKAILRF